MSNSHQNDSEIVRTLRTLVDRGKEKGEWQDATECAYIIGVDPTLLAEMLAGLHEEEALRTVVELVRKALGEPFTAQPVTPTELERLYEEGVRHKLWSSFVTCGAALKVDRKSLSDFLKADPVSLSAKRRTFLKSLVQKMRKALGRKGRTVPTPVDDVIAGRTHLPNQEVDGLRFILTAANFQPIEGEFSEKEIADTAKLIEELRRRLGIIAQMQNPEDRRKAQSLHLALRSLFAQVDELFLQDIAIGKKKPFGFMVQMAADRELFTSLRNGGQSANP